MAEQLDGIGMTLSATYSTSQWCTAVELCHRRSLMSEIAIHRLQHSGTINHSHSVGPTGTGLERLLVLRVSALRTTAVTRTPAARLPRMGAFARISCTTDLSPIPFVGIGSITNGWCKCQYRHENENYRR